MERFQLEIFECDICMEDAVRVLAEEEAKPICATATAIYNTVQTVGEMCDAMKAHRAECAICGCTRKDVVSDRLMVNTAAVCCGKAVA